MVFFIQKQSISGAVFSNIFYDLAGVLSDQSSDGEGRGRLGQRRGVQRTDQLGLGGPGESNGWAQSFRGRPGQNRNIFKKLVSVSKILKQKIRVSLTIHYACLIFNLMTFQTNTKMC